MRIFFGLFGVYYSESENIYGVHQADEFLFFVLLPLGLFDYVIYDTLLFSQYTCSLSIFLWL